MVSAPAPAPAPAPLSAVQAPPAASVLPRSARLTYRTSAQVPVLGFPFTIGATTITTWKLQGGGYECHLQTDRVDFEQDSGGRLVPGQGLQPLRYAQKRPMHSLESVEVDWDRKALRTSVPAESPAVGPGAQDRLSVQFQFAWMHAEHPERLAPGSRVPMELIGPHGTEHWEFDVDAPSELRIGETATPAVRLHARRMAGTREETMEVWLADSVRWFPARIRLVDRNKSIIDFQLREVNFE